jgi:hypothetical protein
MLANPRKFKSVIYRGHFERGGVAISDSVEVTINRIIYQQKISGLKPSKASRYILFGNTAEQFIAHIISSPPDFDQIIFVKCQTFQEAQQITVDKNGNQVLGVSGNTITVFSQDVEMKLNLLKQLYLEFDDLKTAGHH